MTKQVVSELKQDVKITCKCKSFKEHILHRIEQPQFNHQFHFVVTQAWLNNQVDEFEDLLRSRPANTHLFNQIMIELDKLAEEGHL